MPSRLIRIRFLTDYEYTSDASLPQYNDITSFVRLKRAPIEENVTTTETPSSYREIPTKINSDRPAASDATLLVMGNATITSAGRTNDTADKSYAIVPEPVTITDRPLLGVNGTGQRKEQPKLSITKPTLVSEPISTTNMDEVIDSIDISSDNSSETLLAKEHNLTVVIKDVSDSADLLV